MTLTASDFNTIQLDTDSVFEEASTHTPAAGQLAMQRSKFWFPNGDLHIVVRFQIARIYA